MKPKNNIFSVFDKIANRQDKETLLKQRSTSVWLMGLSGAGKTTIGIELEKLLISEGFLTQILDGDNIRSGINKNLKFTEADREENIRRIAEVNKLFLNCGVITINCFINPTEESRNFVSQILNPDDIFQVYINTPIEVCEARDTKGLYAKARRGEIKNFTGISSPFEPPKSPDFVVNTTEQSPKDAAKQILETLRSKLKK
ncbi:MAG: adenylyl-sulfate kinase [Bacteroidota bacterium]|nr:adenylyl-sulfate kinase [Bacteroidota bacterium]